MICGSCREQNHEACRGGSWCDCQHHAPRTGTGGQGAAAGEPPVSPPEEPAGEPAGEPPVNWKRQG